MWPLPAHLSKTTGTAQNVSKSEVKVKAKQLGLADAEGWAKERERLKAGQYHVGWCKTSCAGLLQMELQDVDGTRIYAWCWFRHETGNVIAIHNSYVHEPVRRCGLRTALHKKLLEWYPDTRLIVTGRATELSLPYLKKMGFVFNVQMDRWELVVTPPAPAKPKRASTRTKAK
jgi:GNAT superfamily N-acetyltransferase